jgi:hypothetical protein
MSASESVWRQLLPFFNNDQRGRLFAAVFLASGQPVDVTKESLAKELVTESNYENNDSSEMKTFVQCLRAFHEEYNKNKTLYPSTYKLITKGWSIAPATWSVLQHYVNYQTGEIIIKNILNVLPSGGGINIKDAYENFSETRCLQQNNKGFITLKTDSIVRKRLVGLKNKSERYPVASKPVEDVISLTDKNVWKYDGSQLYRYDSATGQKLNFGDNDVATQQSLTQNNQCYSSLIPGNNVDCQKHVYECLLDENPNSLAQCWIVADASGNLKGDFYENAKKDIGSMHPLVALRTLQRFGFRTSLKYDHEARMDLHKVESVDHWKNNYLDQKFPGESNNVKNNGNLLKYLDLVVQYVNANPALINKHYSGKSTESVGDWPSSVYADKLGLKKQITRSSAISDYNRLNIHQRTGLIGATILRPPFGGPGVFAPFSSNVMPVGVQFGGSHMQVSGPCGSSLVRNSVMTALKTMEHFNKSLDSESKKKIEEKINNMQKVESELNRTAEYLTEYSSLLESFGDYTSTTLNERTLEDLVSRYNKLTQKHSNEERSMITVLTALHKLAEGQESDELSEINNYSDIRGRV